MASIYDYAMTYLAAAGGTSTNKYYATCGVTAAGAAYTCTVRVWNVGNKPVVVGLGIGTPTLYTLQPGAFADYRVDVTGDGTSYAVISFRTQALGDNVSVFYSSLKIQKAGVPQTLNWVNTGSSYVYMQTPPWHVVTMPSSPTARQLQFGAIDSVAQTVSPFTGATQTQQWIGGDRGDLGVTLPPMRLVSANNWIAFLMALRGRAKCFAMGDPLGRNPQGNPQVQYALTNGVQPVNTQRLWTKGWPTSGTGLLYPGDYMQIGWRLYRVASLSAISADGAGGSYIDIWPALREQLADSVPMLFYNTVGLFRLADNRREWNVDQTKMYGLSFKAVEAR